ncbi:MAG: hypothetical protein P8N31_00745 [Planctomycetota bacterium]|nr:hypothetical protein [Planctomycetota bacterium]MDG2142060.1 hypothetical protein [Planctomycetota bacterium]
MSCLTLTGRLALASLALPLSAAAAPLQAADVVAMEAGPWIVSTTSPAPDGAGLLDSSDSTMIRMHVGKTPRVQTSMAGWLALTGFEPSDIDGFALRPGSQGPAHRSSMAFSLLTNEGGFRDGDILGLAPGGGATVLVSEDALLQTLGVPMGSIDVDALAYDDTGRMLFSTQGFLGGTVLGDVNNGDILRIEPDGSATLVQTEDQVQGAFVLATGRADLIGDVHGLEYLGGNLYVALQGPSDVDGSLLRLGQQPGIVAPEDSFGLLGAELDAIAHLGSSGTWPAVSLDQSLGAPGAIISGQGQGFTPGAPILILIGGQQGFSSGYGLGGFGELALDPVDPWLNVLIQVGGLPIVYADKDGFFGVDFGLSSTDVGGKWMGTTGWSLQAIDLATMELTAPVRIAVQ